MDGISTTNLDYRGFYSVTPITLLNNEESLYINEIKASSFGLGYGTSMLNEILDIADSRGLSVCLNANCTIYEESGLNQEQLQEWYFRHGFNPVLELDPFNSTNFFYREAKQII